MELHANGTIVGGSGCDDSDVLLPQYTMGDSDPDIVLGPDSIATLSFTSGSTGIPKGVKGRHYSLTHFFPWMGDQFDIGQTSKFTMLSGIAHDPIQRDSEMASNFFLNPTCSFRHSSVHPSVLRSRTSCSDI